MELANLYLLVLDEVDALGILPGARHDALNRATDYFANQEFVDRTAIRGWALRQKASEAHHWFLTPTATSPTTPTARARRPQPVVLSSDQIAALQGLKPTERLTRYRQIQARQQ